MPKQNTVKLGFFKGPQFQIHNNQRIAQYGSDKYPFQFGLEKARAILDCLPELQDFVAKHSGGVGPDRFDMAVEDNMRDQAGA